MKKIIFIGITTIVVTCFVVIKNNSNAREELYISQNLEALTKSQEDSDTETSKGCKFNLLHICETSHGDHYLYRNK